MKIKICGIKNINEAKEVCACKINGRKVDFIGLIFAKSKREVDLDTAKNIANIAKENNIGVVGVFKSIQSALEIAKLDFLNVVQIYEKVEDKIIFNKFACQVWQVFSVDDALPDVSGSYDLVLFDAKGKNLGGNGISFSWQLLKNVDFPFALAGALSEENMLEAMKFNPYLLDFNSKLEDENGIKIPEKICKILQLSE